METPAPQRKCPVPGRQYDTLQCASVVSHKSLDFGCHSERSEESRLFKYMRPFTSFRVTRKTFFSILLELRKDIRSGASKEEIARDRQEIRNDLKEIAGDKKELQQDRQELRRGRGELYQGRRG